MEGSTTAIRWRWPTTSWFCRPLPSRPPHRARSLRLRDWRRGRAIWLARLPTPDMGEHRIDRPSGGVRTTLTRTRGGAWTTEISSATSTCLRAFILRHGTMMADVSISRSRTTILYTSDAADEEDS